MTQDIFAKRRQAVLEKLGDTGVLVLGAAPEITIGRAQEVRVTPFGTTVIVTGQDQPKIEQGTMARMSAKMP